MKFFIEDFSSKCDQIFQKLRILTHLLDKFWIKKLHFLCSDIIFIDKEHHECQIIDFVVPYDTRVDDKEIEKIGKCLDLARELQKVWNVKVTKCSVNSWSSGSTY